MEINDDGSITGWEQEFVEEKDGYHFFIFFFQHKKAIQQPDHVYMMSGNKISVKTLNLNADFDIIKEQLDNIVEEYLII